LGRSTATRRSTIKGWQARVRLCKSARIDINRQRYAACAAGSRRMNAALAEHLRPFAQHDAGAGVAGLGVITADPRTALSAALANFLAPARRTTVTQSALATGAMYGWLQACSPRRWRPATPTRSARSAQHAR
jgi:hypothetical protein